MNTGRLSLRLTALAQKALHTARHSLVSCTCAVAMLYACSDHKSHTPDIAEQRTVLVYMAADNNLGYNGFAASDLKEMMEASRSLSQADHLLAFVDGYSREPSYILEIASGDTTRVYTFSENVRSSDAAVLRQVIDWVQVYRPAGSFGLVLWGHATGWEPQNASSKAARRRAYGIDQNHSFTSTWMDIDEMAAAFNGLQQMDFIFADCCAFQCVETAYELRSATRYIIASAAEIPDVGAPYNTVVPHLFLRDNETLCRRVIDAYYVQVRQGYQEPLSAVRTADLQPLAEATRQALATCAFDGPYPPTDSIISYYDRSMFDMKDFMIHSLSADVYAQWLTAFNAAVIYSTWVPVWMTDGGSPHVDFSRFTITEERMGGVSMFVPQRPVTLFLQTLDRYADRMQWYAAAGIDQLRK